MPDERLDRLAEMSKSRNVVHAAVQVVDIGGLVEGASKGEGLGNRFLANIREVDAVVFVLRAFDDDDVPGSPDPLEHLRVVELELALADLETVEKRLAQVERQAKLDRSLGDELAALRRGERRALGRPPAVPRRTRAPNSGSCSLRTSCSPPAGCSPSSTSARTSSTRSRVEARSRQSRRSWRGSTTPATTSK